MFKWIARRFIKQILQGLDFDASYDDGVIRIVVLWQEDVIFRKIINLKIPNL